MEAANLYAHVDHLGLASVIITDVEYPDSAAKKILLEMLREFRKLYQIDQIEGFKEDVEMKN